MIWTKDKPTVPGHYWIRGGRTDLVGPSIIEIYDSATGLRVVGDCCACRFATTPLLTDITTKDIEEWAYITPPSERTRRLLIY